MRGLIALVTWSTMLGNAAGAVTQEQIGSWVLRCPDERPGAAACLLRVERRLFDKGGITADLEVQAEGKSLVPVIALRGLSGEMLLTAALAGHIKASMQFGAGPRQALNCASGGALYLCSPQGGAARTLAAQLPSARAVTVRVAAAVAGMTPLPAQQKTLDLAGTAKALARLRVAGPPQLARRTQTLPSRSPEKLLGLADSALKAAGYPKGLEGLRALLAKYRGN